MTNLEEKMKKLARYELGIDNISGIHPSEISNQLKEKKYWEGIKSSYQAISRFGYFIAWQTINLAELVIGGYIVPANLYYGNYKKAAVGAVAVASSEFLKHIISRPLLGIFRSNPCGPQRIPRLYSNQNLNPTNK